VSTGYGERPILSRLNLNISNDDRIGLLGANGNGKSTFAKLIANRLPIMAGSMRRSQKLDVGFFAQHQVEELDTTKTPFTCLAEIMRDAPESKIRARCAQFGFPNIKADTPVLQLSGGEKARLMMGLATFHGPHLLILDEPTNHLDIDSRAALMDAINEYEGAIILISHDRFLIDACADRLWLVDKGTVQAFDGDMDDYKKLILERSGRRDVRRGRDPEPDSRMAAAKPAKPPSLQKRIAAQEEKMAKFSDLIARIDGALGDASLFRREPVKAATLSRQRSDLEKALIAAEEEWLLLSAESDSRAAS
jgi:ATP-binding cassette subfamily F protein 3